MNANERAQINHDNAGPVDDDFTEVKDHHIATAIAAIKADPDALFDMFAQSSFWKEHAMFLYDNSEQFRAEIARSQRVKDRAQELADVEERQQADEAAIERWESRNER